MDIEMIAHYTKLPKSMLIKYKTMSAKAIYSDSEYINALSNINRDDLEASLPLARRVYEKYMDEWKFMIQNKYNVNSEPMSAYTLGNWVVGVLQYPTSAREILNFHKGLDANMFREFLETLVEVLDDMPSHKEEWQNALTLLAFPLMNK